MSNKFSNGDIVVCVDNNYDNLSLTINKSYLIYSCYYDVVLILDDENEKTWYLHKIFSHTLTRIRSDKLKKLSYVQSR